MARSLPAFGDRGVRVADVSVPRHAVEIYSEVVRIIAIMMLILRNIVIHADIIARSRHAIRIAIYVLNSMISCYPDTHRHLRAVAFEAGAEIEARAIGI
jgi:hypothetical protein